MSALDGLARLIGDDTSGGDGVAGLFFSAVTGGNVFVEALPQAPDVCVAIYSTGGAEADTLNPFDSPHVQLVIRGDRDPRTALDLWYAVYDFVHGLEHVDLEGGTRLMAAIVQQSGPVRMGPDENGRYRFSMNLRLETVNQTSHRP